MTPAHAEIARLYQQHQRAVLATLIRLLGDFDQAEDACHEAFIAALAQWPEQGLPANPRAWLVSAGRFKAIDKWRRQQHEQSMAELPELASECQDKDSSLLTDDELRLVFTCCHPALAIEARLALTLREICGLTTEQVARAFLQSPVTIAQRIVRAKQKIRNAAIPYQVPSDQQLPERLDAVLKVIYLLFNEGYHQSSGEQLLSCELTVQAIRLAEQLLPLFPDAEVKGLLALMWLQQSRSQARLDPQGEVVLLAEQNRALWDQRLITQGIRLTEQALQSGRVGPYALQAAIAAVHAESPTAADTDWAQIIGLYDLLLRLQPSAVVALNRAVAFGQLHGAAAALTLLLPLQQELAAYHLYYVALADCYKKQQQWSLAADALQQALQLCQLEPERRLLQRQLQQMSQH
ncbi:sigma-70 family RNA polymerase sigma factor [Rheinheimera sp.]|uniref:RNA polymerase sigma factor n=1 Tax=Rheinheimera sp. TaxID=1869214 RepID=UPI00307EC37C